MEHFLYFNHFEVGKVTWERNIYHLLPITIYPLYNINCPGPSLCQILYIILPHKYLDNPVDAQTTTRG